MRRTFTTLAVGMVMTVAGCSAGNQTHPVASAAPSRTASAQPVARPSVRTNTKCLAALPKQPDGVLFTDPRVIYLISTRSSATGAILTGRETHRTAGGDDDSQIYPVGPVHSYRVEASAPVVLISSIPQWHQLCTDVRGMLALAPGANDPHPADTRPDPAQHPNDEIAGWAYLAGIQTDKAGAITRIEQIWRP